MLLIVTATGRLVSGAPSVEGLLVLIISAVAGVVMLVGAFILGGDIADDEGGEDLNVKAAVLLDTAARRGRRWGSRSAGRSFWPWVAGTGSTRSWD